MNGDRWYFLAPWFTCYTQKGTVQVRTGLTQKKGTFKICRKSAVVYSSELVVTADLDKNTDDNWEGVDPFQTWRDWNKSNALGSLASLQLDSDLLIYCNNVVIINYPLPFGAFHRQFTILVRELFPGCLWHSLTIFLWGNPGYECPAKLRNMNLT